MQTVFADTRYFGLLFDVLEGAWCRSVDSAMHAIDACVETVEQRD